MDEVAAEEGAKRVVVIAVDASIHAERAFNYYCEQLYRSQHKVVLVHSAEYPRAPMGQSMEAEAWEMEVAKREQELKTMEEYYKDRLKALNVDGKTRFVYHGKPGEAVVHVAEEEHAAMVVVGTRGAGPLRRTILGSTSDYIVHHLNCPVLVCPPPRKGCKKSSYPHHPHHDEEHHEHDEHDHDDHHDDDHRHHHHHKSLFSRFFHHHHHDKKEEAKD